MNILFIADNSPAMHSGSAVRNYYILKALSQEHSIDLIGLTDDVREVNTELYKEIKNLTYTLLERKKLSVVRRFFYLLRGKIPYIEQRKSILLPEHIVKKLHYYDCIHLAELSSYFVIERYAKDLNAKLIMDAHNVEYIQLMSAIKSKRFVEKIIFNQFLTRLKSMEIYINKKVNYLLVCSVNDQDYFRQYIPKEKIFVVPNGVNMRYFKQERNLSIGAKKESFIILFMGLLAYHPNDEGLRYYLTSIYPEIKKCIPHVELHVLGKNAPEWLKREAINDKSIILFGFVKDTRSYIANATICIVPLLSGSGTRLKLLEYMAMKKPVVSTPRGAEGVDVISHRHVLLASTPSEFINAVVLLYRQPSLRNTLGRYAYEFVVKTYDWDSIGKQVNRLYNNFLSV